MTLTAENYEKKHNPKRVKKIHQWRRPSFFSQNKCDLYINCFYFQYLNDSILVVKLKKTPQILFMLNKYCQDCITTKLIAHVPFLKTLLCKYIYTM